MTSKIRIELYRPDGYYAKILGFATVDGETVASDLECKEIELLRELVKTPIVQYIFKKHGEYGFIASVKSLEVRTLRGSTWTAPLGIEGFVRWVNTKYKTAYSPDSIPEEIENIESESGFWEDVRCWGYNPANTKKSKTTEKYHKVFAKVEFLFEKSHMNATLLRIDRDFKENMCIPYDGCGDVCTAYGTYSKGRFDKTGAKTHVFVSVEWERTKKYGNLPAWKALYSYDVRSKRGRAGTAYYIFNVDDLPNKPFIPKEV